MLTAEEIKALIREGEGYNVDFKISVPSKVRDLSQEVCAFANSEGGYLLIGVDNDGRIAGTAIDNDKRSAIQNSIRDISPLLSVEIYSVTVEGKEVWVIYTPSGKEKPYVLSGAIYIREGANSQKLTTAEELRSFFQSSNRIYFDAGTCPSVRIGDALDKETFSRFRQTAGLSDSVSDFQILDNLQVFDEDGAVKNGGVLFFHRQPETLFPQAVIRCVLFKGTDKVHIIDDKIYGGPLFRQYLQAEAWIKDKLKVSYIIEGTGPRREVWEIPLTVFKEAVINALSHRDYYEQGAFTVIEIYDDRVEISNPGGLLTGIRKADFGKKSLSRNPLIFGLFTRMNLVERVASGIPRMREAMRKAGLPEPAFNTDGAFFTVTFNRPAANDTANDTANTGSIDDMILSLIAAHEGISAPALAEKTGKSIATVKRHIAKLRDKVEFRGATKNGGYFIK